MSKTNFADINSGGNNISPKEKLLVFLKDKTLYDCRVEKDENKVIITIPHQEKNQIIWEKTKGVLCTFGVIPPNEEKIFESLCLNFHS